jgi:hypothetical protein
MDESTEAVAPFTSRDERRSVVVDRWRRCQIQRAMGPVRVVVIDEDAEHVLEVAAVEDQEPVEASAAMSFPARTGHTH